MMNSDSLSNRIQRRRANATEAFLLWANMDVDRWNDMKWQDWTNFKPIAHLGIRFGFMDRVGPVAKQVRALLMVEYGGRLALHDISAGTRFLGFGVDYDGAARNAVISMLEMGMLGFA